MQSNLNLQAIQLYQKMEIIILEVYFSTVIKRTLHIELPNATFESTLKMEGILLDI